MNRLAKIRDYKNYTDYFMPKTSSFKALCLVRNFFAQFSRKTTRMLALELVSGIKSIGHCVFKRISKVGPI